MTDYEHRPKATKNVLLTVNGNFLEGMPSAVGRTACITGEEHIAVGAGSVISTVPKLTLYSEVAPEVSAYGIGKVDVIGYA